MGRETGLLEEGEKDGGQIETQMITSKSPYISDPLEYGLVSGKRKISIY